MSLDEKIGQLIVVRYSSTSIQDAVENYHVSGTTFYATDFNNKTEDQVKTMTSTAQSYANIPLITAVDEEGGTVVRISQNSNLAPEKFKSPKELYESSNQTFDLIVQDTKTKSALLKNLGLNMNYAPVVDIADSSAFIYNRTLGYGAEKTTEYAVNVIQASKGTGVSYSLKHFPGYGNNADNHTSSTTDETSIEELWNKHLVPFKSGIEAGAESVMITHNIISAVDKNNPASLSKGVHDILFDNLKFTGIAITDDLDMGSAATVDKRYTKAINAGNNIILLSDYPEAHTELKASVNDGTISEDTINHQTFKVLAWKYYKGLLS